MIDKICPLINKKCIKDKCEFWEFDKNINLTEGLMKTLKTLSRTMSIYKCKLKGN